MENNNPENNFPKYLWNKYEPLHNRLQRKIIYLSKVLGNFNEIYHVKKDYYKALKPFISKEIPVCAEEENFQNVISIVKSTNDKYNEYEEEMYVEIINNITTLIEKMKKEKIYYENYLKSLSIYSEEKKKMERFKSIYHSNAKIAEQSTIYLKELVIKKKLNNDTLINQQIEISEAEANNRLTTMAKDCETYVKSLKNVNILRTKLNEDQKKLLIRYQHLEREDRNLSSTIMNIIRKYQKKILNFTGDKANLVEGIQKTINIDMEIRNLVESLRSREKPEKEIPYIHYPTEIDFDKCNDGRDYKVVVEVIKTMRNYTTKIFTDYNEELEDKKNKMRDLINKFFDMNRTTEESDKEQLLKFIEDPKTHELFLIILSKLRTNNRFCRDKPLIELLSDIIIKILDNAEKTNNFICAKNCMILSQTFYYINELNPNKKVYIMDYIKKHHWFQSINFWKDFILVMILKEFIKLENMNPDKTIKIARNKNIPNNVKPKIGEVLFSQILPYVGNMLEFNVDKKYIIKIIDDINAKYNYMGESNLQSIFDLVVSSKEELKKIREDIQNDKELAGSSLDNALIKKLLKQEGLINAEDEDEEDEKEEELQNKIIN